MIISLLNLQMPTAPVSSMSRKRQRRDGVETGRVRRNLDADLFLGKVAQFGADRFVGFFQGVQGVGHQDAVALVVDEQNEMGALVTFERLMNVEGQLGEQLHRLAPRILRINRQGAVENGQRFLVAALVKLDPAVELQGGGGLGIVLERLGGDRFGVGEAPGFKDLFAGFEFAFGFGAVELARPINRRR